MATIKYLLQSKFDYAPIYLRLSLGHNNTIKRKTGLNINPSDWSKATGLPKQNNHFNKNLTTDLKDLESFIIKKLNDANRSGNEISGSWLLFNIDLHFNRINENKQSELITDAIQNIIDNAEFRKNGKGGIGLSKGRVNSYKTLKKIINDYSKSYSYKVKDVNVKLANDLLKYLIQEKKYSYSYSAKKISDLKVVCFDAETNGIETHPQLKKIKIASSKNENIIYLKPSELQKIEKADVINTSLDNARKWLLLGCNIGQRGGDLLNLNENNFVDRNGLYVIELKQQKTGKNVTIPILDPTEKILENGLPYKISIQKFNKHIKKICKIAGISQITKGKLFDAKTNRNIEGEYPKHKLITSHVCRRSFATNSYGILPTPLIMQITAHGTEKMFLNYIGKSSLDYAQQIADFYTLQALKEKKESNLTIVKKAN